MSMLGISDRIAEGRSTIGSVLLAFMALGFASLIAAGVAAGWVTVRNQEHTRWVNHTYEVELDVATAWRLVEQAETARRGYLLTSDQAFMAVYGDATQRLGPAISDLRDLTRDNPRQQQAISALRPHLASLAVARERSIALADAGEDTAAVASFRAETSA
ncbi:MAG: histidine kinase, partial [Alphaproteobacteria bacterium]